MAGTISFSITGNATEMVAATVNAQRAMAGLKITAADINAAFARANAGTATGISAAELKSKSRALNGALSNAAMTAGMFAENTRLTRTELQRTNGLLEKLTTANYVNQ